MKPDQAFLRSLSSLILWGLGLFAIVFFLYPILCILSLVTPPQWVEGWRATLNAPFCFSGGILCAGYGLLLSLRITVPLQLRQFFVIAPMVALLVGFFAGVQAHQWWLMWIIPAGVALAAPANRDWPEEISLTENADFHERATWWRGLRWQRMNFWVLTLLMPMLAILSWPPVLKAERLVELIISFYLLAMNVGYFIFWRTVVRSGIILKGNTILQSNRIIFITWIAIVMGLAALILAAGS